MSKVPVHVRSVVGLLPRQGLDARVYRPLVATRVWLGAERR